MEKSNLNKALRWSESLPTKLPATSFIVELVVFLYIMPIALYIMLQDLRDARIRIPIAIH